MDDEIIQPFCMMYYGEDMINLDSISLFILIAGFVLGLGAVTVINIHGYLGRKSAYWTEATTRTHKITKPLIWTGTLLALVGGTLFYRNEAFEGAPFWLSIIAPILVLNGCFLSFVISPYLLRQEREGRPGDVLPKEMQRNITVSFIVSDVGWWGALLIIVHDISTRI